MELYTVEFLLFVLSCSYGTYACLSRNSKSGSRLCDIYSMAHPAYGLFGYALKYSCIIIYIYYSMTILSDGSCCYLTAQEIVHELSAVADTQDGNAEIEDSLIASGSIVVTYITGAARKDDSHGS